MVLTQYLLSPISVVRHHSSPHGKPQESGLGRLTWLRHSLWLYEGQVALTYVEEKGIQSLRNNPLTAGPITISILVLILATAGCDALSAPRPFPVAPTLASVAFPTVAAGRTPSATPNTASGTPIWIDSFFSGQAFLDSNGNGEIDSTDAPLARALFIARDARGAEFGSYTNPEGSATVSYPGGAVYPVTLRIKTPEGSNFILIGPAEVSVADSSGGTAKFLFALQPITRTPAR